MADRDEQREKVKGIRAGDMFLWWMMMISDLMFVVGIKLLKATEIKINISKY